MRDFLMVMFQCTVSMSLATLAYAALTPLLSKRYAAKWRYWAWLAIAAGWVFPFRPRIELPFLPPQTAEMQGTPVQTIVNTIAPAVGAVADTGDLANAPAAIPVWWVLAAVWILGVVTVTAYHVLRHGRFMKTARRWSESVTDTESLRLLDDLKSELGIKANVELNVCQSVTTPMLVGFFRPVILLPPVKITGDELHFVLKHELVHFQRRDLRGKTLVLAATVLHWFNPAVYLMARAAAAQCELSCDAQVLRDADFHGRKQYGETIIGVVRNGSSLRTALSTNFYGGKNGMKNRIFAIMDTKQKKLGAAVFCVVVASVITIGTAFAAASTDTGTAAIPDNGISVVEDGDTVLFRNDTDRVSLDGGQTWMDGEAYRKLYPPSDPLSDVEWYTYDEYKAYADEQKKTLPAMIGAEFGYYDEQGILHKEVWTQERVDETIRLLEQSLEYMKSGGQISKPVNGREYVTEDGVWVAETIGLSMKHNTSVASLYGGSITLGNGETKDLGSYATKEEAFAAAKAFCNEQVKAGNMTRREADRFLSQYK
jgi:beta-lactamase regulating signal transducer with metallopeptidase domain